MGLDIASCITILIWIIKYYGDFSANLSSYRGEIQSSIIITRMNSDANFNIKIVLALLIALQYARFIIALQVSRTFGPMVKILTSMIINLILFIVLFCAVFFIFAGSGLLLFQELSAYNDMYLSCSTLFSSALGNFDYTIYDSLKDVSPRLGYTFLTLFLVIISIMLLNFLIAILSNTYSILNNVKNGLYLKNVISLRQVYNYDKYYASIVSMPPPFGILTFITVPFVIYCKSKLLNKILLIIEYSIIGVSAVVIFICFCIIMTPFAYLLILFDKLKKIPQRPFLNKLDLLIRALDFIIFFFCGILFLFFWTVIDSINLALNLFSKDIMPIDQDELSKRNKSISENAIKKSQVAEETKSFKFTAIKSKGKSTNKGLGKGTNPIKEGLSEMTLNILKACIRNLKNRHQENVDSYRFGHEINHSFIPTVSILEEMKTHLLVQEQINIILFGVTYLKKEDYFFSDKFDMLVDCLTDNENIEEIALSNSVLDLSLDHRLNLNNIRREKTITENLINDRKDYWESQIKDFLIKGDEKWILDQFNLCKRFVNQNSIEGSYKDFEHPAFESFSSIRNIKKKLNKDGMESSRVPSPAKFEGKRISQKAANSELLSPRRRERALKDTKEEEYRKQNLNTDSLKIMKCDISALLKAIEEIENRIKMEKILNKKKSSNQKDCNEEEIVDSEMLCRLQFSMLNFNRNYIALKYAQMNPTDKRNAM